MIRSNSLRLSILAALAGLATVPAFAEDVTLQKQVETLRAAIEAQRAQLDAQAKLLEAQQAQLEALTKQMQQSKVAAQDAAKQEAPKQEAPKMAAQEAPKVTFTNNRPTIASADGRSSIAFRSNVRGRGHLRQHAFRSAH